jgi:hypothetical protein
LIDRNSISSLDAGQADHHELARAEAEGGGAIHREAEQAIVPVPHPFYRHGLEGGIVGDQHGRAGIGQTGKLLRERQADRETWGHS